MYSHGTPTISLKSLIAANSGHPLPPGQWKASIKRQRELERLTDVVAAKLIEDGENPFRTVKHPIFLVGLHSGECKELTPYRNSNLLPIIQSSNHRAALRTLEFYVKDRPYVRMFVFSAGVHCPCNKLRERHRLLARKISKWAASPICKKRNVETIIARHEITFDELCYCHLHAHVLVDCGKHVGSEDWKKFLGETHAFFDAQIDDSGVLKKPAEAVKYVLKPGVLERLSPGMVGELFRQLHNQKLCRFMGGLAELRKELKAENVSLGKKKTEGAEVESWEWVKVQKSGNGDAVYHKRKARHSSDIILAITKPCAPFGPELEPCLVVADYGGDLDALLKKRDLEHWLKARPSVPSTLDTTTTTVPSFPKDSPADSTLVVNGNAADIQPKKAAAQLPGAKQKVPLSKLKPRPVVPKAEDRWRVAFPKLADLVESLKAFPAPAPAPAPTTIKEIKALYQQKEREAKKARKAGRPAKTVFQAKLTFAQRHGDEAAYDNIDPLTGRLRQRKS